MSAHAKFLEIKNRVIELIHDESRLVSFTPKFRTSGIYMLYVDCCYDDNILPIYIGQTKDFTKRYRAHLRDVRQINNLPPHHYHNSFFWSGWYTYSKDYNGKFKACKIFQYMVDHHCNMEDLKMLVVEYCSADSLVEKEKYYIDSLLSAYFGFNQINSIANPFLYRDNKEKYYQYLQEDAELLNKYMEYGYSKFNYLQGFREVRTNPYHESMEARSNAAQLMPTTDELTLKKEQCINASKAYQALLEQQTPLIHASFAEDIHEIFTTYKFKSQRREEEVLFAFLNHHTSRIDPIRMDTINYLKYYFSRDRRSTECGCRLTEYFYQHVEEIKHISAPVLSTYDAYINMRHQFIANSRFSLIFPHISYSENPLNDSLYET